MQKGEEVNPSTSGGMVIARTQSGSAKIVPMAPGETWTHQIIVSELFDLSKPGVYTIQAKRFAAGVLFKSNIVRVTVTR